MAITHLVGVEGLLQALNYVLNMLKLFQVLLIELVLVISGKFGLRKRRQAMIEEDLRHIGQRDQLDWP